MNSHECWGLLGKNGAGKTTLIHSILGIVKPAEGSIKIDATPIQSYHRRELAQRIGILFQEGMNDFPATVEETVLLGRYPHTHPFFQKSKQDLNLVEEILKELSLDALKSRKLETLSGGELQRVAIAMLFAQDPKIFLLDEPSNNLDIAFQISLLKILKERTDKNSGCMLLATHDINLAARFCDRLILLIDKDEFLIGTRQEILTTENLTRAFGCEIKTISEKNEKFYYPK